MDGVDEDSGEVGPRLESASKIFEESLSGTTPQEAFEEITPNTSSDKHCVETKVVENPGNSPPVHDLERLM